MTIKSLTVLLALLLPTAALSDISTTFEQLIFNEARTYAGHEFNNQFISLWSSPRGINHYEIVLREEKGARGGKQILILVNNKQLVSAAIQAKSSDTSALVASYVDYVKNHLHELAISGELTPPEISFSGL